MGGWGQAVETGGTQWIAIDGPMIITNTFASSCTNPAADTPCVVESKLVECVYGVTVNYGSSTVSLKTGPPGEVTTNTTHRCWTFAVGSDSVLYNRGAAGAACPDAPAGGSSTGSIASFKSTLPAGYGAACADVSRVRGAEMSSLLPYNYTASSGSKLWLQPNAITFGPSFGINTDAEHALVRCLTSGGDSAMLVDPASKPLSPVFKLQLTGMTNGCLVVKQSLGVGVLQTALPSTACSAVVAEPLAWSYSLSANFPNWTAPVLASTGAAAAPAPPPTELKPVPVVQYSLALGGTWSALAIADPCTGVPLRLAAAAAMAAKVPGFDASSLAMGTVTDPSGVSITLAPNSPVNTLTAVPAGCRADGTSPTSRRLGAQRPVAEALSGVALVQGPARRLPATPSVGMVAQVPGGQTPSAMAASAATTGAPVLPPSLASATTAAPSGVVSAVAVAAVPITYAPRKNPYVVDPLIKEFHNLPRVCLYGCVGAATNTFTLTTTYAQGAIGLAAGLFALAVISLIIYSIAYTCGLCACASCKCRKARDPATLRHICAPRTVYIVFGLINIGLLLATVGYLGRFPTGLQQLVDGLDYFAGNFTVAGKYLANEPCGETSAIVGTSLASCGVKSFDFRSFTSGDFKAMGISPAPTGDSLKPHDIRSIYGSAKIAIAEVATLKTSCGNVCPSAVGNILDAISSGNDAAAGMTGSFGPLMTSVGTMITDALKGLNPSAYKDQVTLGGYAVMGLLAAFVAIYTFFVCKSTCACCIHGLSSVFTIILVTILMIITGIFYAFGVIGADICYDPNATLMTLASSNMPSGMAGDTLAYYLTCGANPSTKAIGAAGMIGGMISQVQGAAVQVQDLAYQAGLASNAVALGPLNSATPDFTTATGTKAMSSLSTHIGYSADAVTSLAGVMSCATMDPILSTLWTGACTNGIATIIGIARILIVASVLLFIQLGVGIDMCCFHPGLTSRYWAEEGVDPEGDGGASGAPKGGVTMRDIGHSSV